MQGKIIVVAVDGSPASDAAVDAGLVLAGAMGSHVQFIHAASPLEEEVFANREDSFGVPTEAEILEHDDLLAAAAERASQTGVECDVRLIPEASDLMSQTRNADLAAAIADIAEGLEAGMIVVGSRGRGVFTGAVLGSVSLNLIKVATVPVLVVNAPAEE